MIGLKSRGVLCVAKHKMVIGVTKDGKEGKSAKTPAILTQSKP